MPTAVRSAGCGRADRITTSCSMVQRLTTRRDHRVCSCLTRSTTSCGRRAMRSATGGVAVRGPRPQGCLRAICTLEVHLGVANIDGVANAGTESEEAQLEPSGAGLGCSSGRLRQRLDAAHDRRDSTASRWAHGHLPWRCQLRHLQARKRSDPSNGVGQLPSTNSSAASTTRPAWRMAAVTRCPLK